MGSGPPCGGGRSCRRDVQRSGNLETLWEWRPPTPYRGQGTPGGMRTPRGRPWDPQRGQGTWGAGPLGIETASWKGTPVQEWGSPPKMGIPLDGLGPPPLKKWGHFIPQGLELPKNGNHPSSTGIIPPQNGTPWDPPSSSLTQELRLPPQERGSAPGWGWGPHKDKAQDPLKMGTQQWPGPAEGLK